MSLLGLCLAVVTLLLLFIDLKYFRGPRAPSASFCNLTAVTHGDEAAQEANHEFRKLRRRIVQMVMDACGALGLLLLALYSVRILAFGKESLSDDELYHAYSLVVWQSICAIFHYGLLDFGDREILFLVYGFNLATLSLAFSPDATALEQFVMIGRIIGSIIFLDFRHGFCINVLFSARRIHLLAFASHQPLGQSIFVQEVCVTICILMIPWAIENIARQWISVLLSANELGLSLQAVRSVVAMSSDAQGELDKDMRLLQVSPKLAHFFQKSPSSLEGRSFLELVEEDDHQRVQTVLQSAKEMAQQQGKPVPLNLNVSKRNGQHKDLRIHVCSLASELCRGPQYFFAMSEVQEKVKSTDSKDGDEAGEAAELGASSAAASSHQPRLTSEALAAHSWAMPVQNTSSLWEVKVQVDEASLEVQEINIILNTNHWKKSRKTYLSECILPGVWDDFKRWIQASLKGRQGTPPFIVPFGFPRIMCAIACARHVELKRKIGSTGRHELSLRLKHIFARRPMTPSVPPPRLSTMSHESL